MSEPTGPSRPPSFTSLANARALLATAGLTPKKSWGQNFLTDDTVLEDIARASGAAPHKPVVELGAGLGALTAHLVAGGGPVVAIERDRELVPLLAQALGEVPGFDLREANAATLDYAALARELGCKLSVVGNLPYQLSSRILVSLADAGEHIERAVLLVQREVAERIVAEPGSRTYGLLTVLVQRAFDAERIRDVAASAFHPPPKVSSAVVRLWRKARPFTHDQDVQLVAAARHAFSARRKTLRNSLAGSLRIEGERAGQLILAAGLDPMVRAERLGLADFARLGETLAAEGLVSCDGSGLESLDTDG